VLLKLNQTDGEGDRASLSGSPTKRQSVAGVHVPVELGDELSLSVWWTYPDRAGVVTVGWIMRVRMESMICALTRETPKGSVPVHVRAGHEVRAGLVRPFDSPSRKEQLVADDGPAYRGAALKEAQVGVGDNRRAPHRVASRSALRRTYRPRRDTDSSRSWSPC